jgi:DHA2 family multidrug resistance protein-like MFS transporter
MLSLSQLEPATDLKLLVGGYMIMMFGINIAITLTTDNVMTVAPPERAGAASGISETSAELGAALGVAVLGSIAAAAYRAHMITALGASDIPSVAGQAKTTLAVAVASARALGGTTGAVILGAARESFTSAVAMVAALSAAAIFIVTVLSAIVLRQRRST